MILSLLFLTPLFNFIPDASLAAVIISAVYDLIDFSLLPKLWRVNSTYLSGACARYRCRRTVDGQQPTNRIVSNPIIDMNFSLRNFVYLFIFIYYE